MIQAPALSQLVVGALAVLAVGGCSNPDQGASAVDTVGGRTATSAIDRESALADTLSAECPVSGRRGSLLIPRPQPDDESGVTFRLLGDGAGPGVTLCRDTLYADVASLLDLMGESARVTASRGRAVVDSVPTEIPAYDHGGVLYVAVLPFARQRRALLVPSAEHRMDATIWPQATLLYMKTTGRSGGVAYESAVREGLVPAR